MPEAALLDTNILLYACLQYSEFHQRTRRALQELQGSDCKLIVSSQSLREMYVGLTRLSQFTRSIAPDDAAAYVRAVERSYLVVHEKTETIEHFLQLVTKYGIAGLKAYDANLVALMLTHKIPAVLTNDIDGFKRFAGLIRILPLT